MGLEDGWITVWDTCRWISPLGSSELNAKLGEGAGLEEVVPLDVAWEHLPPSPDLSVS